MRESQQYNLEPNSIIIQWLLMVLLPLVLLAEADGNILAISNSKEMYSKWKVCGSFSRFFR